MSSPATSNSQLATHSDEVLVRVQGVSKKFCRSLKKSLWYGVCDIGAELNPFRRRVAEVAGSGLLVAGNGSKQDSSELATSDSPLVTPHGLRPDEFYAVRDVSFELRRGECLGLIGHNGAGKTTLLKMLNGLIKPDSGKITMRGRVGALIALGAGFNPILTGRENIYINGSVLGLSKKEIDGKIDEIIDFAEIGEFIDSPVQNYSSGMSVRLGFSIASSLSPDVLILDEVLAVGDDQFRLKCLARIGRLLSSGVAGILVTHQMQNIERICTRCNVMAHAKIALSTWNIPEAIRFYRGLAQEPVGAVELVYGPNPQLVLEKAYFDAVLDAVLIYFRALYQSLPPIFVTYSLRLNGNELLRKTSRGEQETIRVSRVASMRVNVPNELRRLGNLRLDISLWDESTRQPLVWIKSIEIPGTGEADYRLQFQVEK